MKITVLFADPGHIKLRLPNAIWLASGLDEASAELLRRGPSCEQAERICREFGDSIILRLVLKDQKLVRIDGWRGISSGFELFYALRPDGSVLVSDHFRHLLAEIPVADRSSSEFALVEHLLFRAVTAPQTYAQGVKRLGHGERLSIDPATQAVEVSQFDRLDYEWQGGSKRDYLDRVDDALAKAVGRFGEPSNLVVLFSGGVDSTLVQTYLPKGTSALFFAPESVNPGTPDPLRYAGRAAELLQMHLEVHRLKDTDTWANLESNIDLAGWPQRVIQTTMYAQGYTWPAPGGFVQGGRGDALFGAAGTRSALLADKARALPFRAMLELAARIPAHPVSERARRLLQTSRRMEEDPASPLGWAAGMSSIGYTDLPAVRDAVGAELVTERYAKRLLYAQSRLGGASERASHLGRHLELAHWIDYWCEDATAFARQLGLAHRKSVHMPFLAAPLVRAAMTIPLDERYIRGLNVKYLLKDVLKRRLPAYPVNQKKGITSMRLPSRYKGEDRAAVWEDYPLPSLIPERHRQRILSFHSPMSFCALTYAMLDRRVLRNPHLPRLSGVERLEFSAGMIYQPQQEREQMARRR
jgi:asparagine synthetase B (glutamine-hydrolysing)